MNEFLAQWLADPIAIRILVAITGLIIIGLFSRAVRTAITRYIKVADTRYRLRKISSLAGYIIVVLMLAIIFGDRIGNLAVAMGVAGAGIAFALQEVIASFAGWFAITFAGFYKPGDRVQLGGIKGDVIDISFLRTTLMEVGEWVDADLYNGRVVRVANSFVFKEPVFNYSGEFPFLWDEITVPVMHGSDHHLARRILQSAGQEIIGEYSKGANDAWEGFSKQFLLEDAAVNPIVTLTANDNWIMFTLRYVVSYKVRRSTKDRLFTSILDEFGKTNGAVRFASTTLQLVEASALNIKVTDDLRVGGSLEKAG